jgi:hypothetical protein
MAVVAYIEPKWWGHHPAIAKLAIKALLDAGHLVLCVCANPGSVQSWLQHQGIADASRRIWYERLTHQESFLRLPRPCTDPLLQFRGREWIAARAALERVSRAARLDADISIFGLLDGYLNPHLPADAVDRFFPHPWTGFVMFAHWLLNAPGPPPPPTAARMCRELYFEDETLVDLAAEVTLKPCYAFPACADVSTSAEGDRSDWANAAFHFKASERLIGLVGCTDRRKGIFELLEIARLAQGQPYRFLIFGSPVGRSGRRDISLFGSRYKNLKPPNVLWRRGFIPDEPTFNGVLKQLDMLWLGYERFPYSTGQLAKAAFFRKPVVANVGGLIATRIRRFNLGVVSPVFHAETTLHNLATYFEQANARLQPRFEDYYQQHSLSQFTELIRTIADPSRRPAPHP